MEVTCWLLGLAEMWTKAYTGVPLGADGFPAQSEAAVTCCGERSTSFNAAALGLLCP